MIKKLLNMHSCSFLSCFVVGLFSIFLLSCRATRVRDFSGEEISSILPSEICQIGYRDLQISCEISRKVKDSDLFEIKLIDLRTKSETRRTISSSEIVRLFGRYSTIKALGKITAGEPMKPICTFDICTFGLEPQEYDIYGNVDGKVILGLSKKEFYVVDIPLELLRQTRSLIEKFR